MSVGFLDKVNGAAMLFRFILPLMVSMMMYMIVEERRDTKEMRVLLENHLRHDMIQIFSRLDRIESEVGIPPR